MEVNTVDILKTKAVLEIRTNKYTMEENTV